MNSEETKIDCKSGWNSDIELGIDYETSRSIREAEIIMVDELVFRDGCIKSFVSHGALKQMIKDIRTNMKLIKKLKNQLNDLGI